MSSRQTVSFLRRRLQEVGLQPDKRHGQNFLIDLNLIDLIARSAELTDKDVVLEVGTGMGSLTGLMAGQIVTVEIDAGLAQIATEELEGFSNITLLQQDALRNKNNIHPTVIETIHAKLDEIPDSHLKLVANLPYNIATPLISNLLHWERMPSLMAVTIQKELADRIMASPSTKDYSALSIWVQSLAEVELVRDLPPGVFWPAPKVDSAIIRIRPQLEKRALIPDLRFFHTFVRALFFHRRKYLRSVLNSAFKRELEKSDVDEVLDASRFMPNMRAEQLAVEEIRELSELFRAKVNEKQSASS
jgi:16S rRNA (adenine1518-N6/adenine1519-N6)-dimethyltransferase